MCRAAETITAYIVAESAASVREQFARTLRCLKKFARRSIELPTLIRGRCAARGIKYVLARATLPLRESHFPSDDNAATGGLRAGHLRKCKDSRGRNFQPGRSHNSTVIFPGLFHSHRQYRVFCFYSLDYLLS